MKKIMFIGAHPDDIELGCAGTIKRCLEKDIEIIPVICSWGSFRGEMSQRKSEQETVFKLLHISEYVSFNWKDTEIKINGENIAILEAIISTNNPDFIFTHYPNDTHQDHRAVAEMVKSICYRMNKNLIYFDSNSSVSFSPNYFQEINWSDKEKILPRFVSQMLNSNYLDKVKAKNRLYGIQSGKDCAEGFYIERLIGGIL